MTTGTTRSTGSTGLLITGNEEFLRARITRAFLDRLRVTEPDLSRSEADADGLTVHDLHERLGPTLFGGFPVLVITDGNKLSKDALAAVAAYVTDPTCAVIVDLPEPHKAGGKAVVTALQQAGATHEAVTAPKNAGDRRRFAQAELGRVGIRASSDTVNALADGETSYRGIAIRADQLAADHTPDTAEPDGHAATQPTITPDHVDAITTSGQATGFAVADALIARNPHALTHATREALAAGAAPLFIQAACATALRDLAALKTGTSRNMPPWKAQKLRPATTRWNAPMLATALHEIGIIGETVRSSARSETFLLAALLRIIQ